MANKIGPKGQLVIEKAIRDRLGVKPGWITVQLLVGDHVQIHFVPPEHDESVAGVLADYAKPELNPEDALRRARERAWTQAAKERWTTQPGEE